MGPLYLVGLAAQKAGWLATRQNVVAQNISNASTPGFKAADIRPFSDILQSMPVAMSATHSSHLGSDVSGGPGSVRMGKTDIWEVSHSGNSVSLEQEMMKSSEINREFALNTGILKAVHHMLMMNVKG